VSIWTKTTLVLTLSGAVLCLSGCRVDTVASSLPAGDVDYCTVMADPPVKIGKHIAGPGRYRCDGRGAGTITITVTIEKKITGGRWRSLSTRTFVAHGTNTSRDLSEADRTRRVTSTCASGQFRTKVHAVEKSNGHTQNYDSHSITVRDPCDI
jgi:hypothetical protein